MVIVNPLVDAVWCVGVVESVTVMVTGLARNRSRRRSADHACAGVDRQPGRQTGGRIGVRRSATAGGLRCRVRSPHRAVRQRGVGNRQKRRINGYRQPGGRRRLVCRDGRIRDRDGHRDGPPVAVVGVPLIAPVLALIDSPAGRPVAE